MKTFTSFLVILFVKFSYGQDLPTEVFCGKVSSAKKVSQRSPYDIKVKLVKVQSGLIVENKVVLDSEYKKVTKILYPTKLETDQQKSLPLFALQLLTMLKASSRFVCISFPLSKEAFDTGFPHEFGKGQSLSEAVEDLEGNINF